METYITEEVIDMKTNVNYKGIGLGIVAVAFAAYGVIYKRTCDKALENQRAVNEALLNNYQQYK